MCIFKEGSAHSKDAIASGGSLQVWPRGLGHTFMDADVISMTGIDQVWRD